MKKKLIILTIIVFAFSPLIAQVKQTEVEEQIWTGYFNQTRFSKRWGAWFDGQLRTKENFFKDLSVAIIRPGITYYVNNATKLTAGYAYIAHFPAAGHNDVTRPEHRPWQQVQWHTSYGRVKTMQYLRLEERFRRKVLNDSTLGSGHDFNFRIRYNFLLQVPLTNKPVGPGDLSFIANDEVHINFGKKVVNNYFDQNRFFLGFAYHVNASDNIQFGYTNIFIQLPAGNRYRSLHVARLFYFHNLDLRSKK
ncbi:MAG TPA: DUF2490 domain-containing protein [Flavisolibacter sp.]|nr:DUF2490 domain-containing protein [Flavisolibacter sp.]